MKEINLDSTGPLVRAFVDRLMAHEGFNVKVPLEISSVYLRVNNRTVEEVAMEILEQTSELLTMMGVAHTVYHVSWSIKVHPTE